MFNKTKPSNRDERPALQPVPQIDTASVNLTKKPAASGMGMSAPGKFSSFGSGLVIDGNVSGTGDLHLDGTVHGDVKVTHLTVGESGNIEGKVEAETIEIRGRVVGSILGKQIKLQATAYVEGDISHEQLAIDVGAYFQGRCLQTRRPEPTPAMSSIAAPAGDHPAPSLSTYDMNALSDLK